MTRAALALAAAALCAAGLWALATKPDPYARQLRRFTCPCGCERTDHA